MKYIIGIIAGTIAGVAIGYILARNNEEVVCCCGCEDARKCPDFVEAPVNKCVDDNDMNGNGDPNKFKTYEENNYGV